MIHVTVEHEDQTEATKAARFVYSAHAEAGRHVILDAPGSFLNNLPERRMSSADVLITARKKPTQATNTP